MSEGVLGRLGRLRRSGGPVAAPEAPISPSEPSGPPAWLELSEDSLDSLPPDGQEVRLLVRDAGVVRSLTRSDGPRFSRVVVGLTSWRAPTPGWRGALGPVP